MKGSTSPAGDPVPVALEVQALYSAAALARVANFSTDLLRRVLHANGIVFVRTERALLVPVSRPGRRFRRSRIAAADRG